MTTGKTFSRTILFVLTLHHKRRPLSVMACVSSPQAQRLKLARPLARIALRCTHLVAQSKTYLAQNWSEAHVKAFRWILCGVAHRYHLTNVSSVTSHFRCSCLKKRLFGHEWRRTMRTSMTPSEANKSSVGFSFFFPPQIYLDCNEDSMGSGAVPGGDGVTLMNG